MPKIYALIPTVSFRLGLATLVIIFATTFNSVAQSTNLTLQFFASPSPLRVSVTNEHVPAWSPVSRAYVTEGTNRFAFLMPDGFRLNNADPGKILLTSSDLKMNLMFSVVGSTISLPPQLEVEPCRDRLLKQHPGAEITDTFSRSASNQSGPAFDFTLNNDTGTAQHIRTVFIPTSTGRILQFTLSTNAEMFEEASHAFNLLLLTFRAEENGKLDITPLSGEL